MVATTSLLKSLYVNLRISEGDAFGLPTIVRLAPIYFNKSALISTFLVC